MSSSREIASEAIDRMLVQKHMSRKDFADSIGVDKSTMTRYLNRQISVPERRMTAMAEVLGVDTLVIFPLCGVTSASSTR